jgi:hypothetical protein
MENREYKCEKCGKAFKDAAHLRRHAGRKTQCAPFIEGDKTSTTCRYCGRTFASRPSMNRHVRQYCKIANSAEGMEKLMEHTIKQQLDAQAAKTDAQTAKVDALQTQVAELTALLREQLGAGPAPSTAQAGASQTVNIGSVANTTMTTNIAQVNQQIIIRPWDGAPADRIHVPPGLIAAAFAENPRLKEYCRLGDNEKTDPKVAPPFVLEMLMDLVKRAHTDPAARNVYLNPKRADQALVCLKTGRWEVVQLADATRLLFDGVVVSIHAVTLSDEKRKQLPFEAQHALAMAGLAYSDEPEEYARRAKGPMAAHLANTAPVLTGSIEERQLRCSVLPVAPALAPTFEAQPTRAGAGAPEAGCVAPLRGRAAPKLKEEKRFTQTDAAALLQAHRPPRVGEVDAAYIKGLARAAGVEVNRVVRKLWEAAEDRLLSSDDDQTARAVCSVYDENPDLYD